MDNTTKSFEISYPENAHEAFATENTPLPAEVWNEAWDAEIEAEKTNPSLLKRISDAIPTPVKAAAAGTILAATQLLSPESAEARPVPPNWTPGVVAEQQNRLHRNTFINVNHNFTAPEQVALAFKNNMMRGEGVRIETQLDVHLSRCGIIAGKTVVTNVERNDGNFANSWVTSEGSHGPLVNRFYSRPPATQARMFDIISENGRVTKVDHGYYNF